MEKSDGYVLCALNGTPGSPRPPLFFCNLANLAAAKAKRVASLQSRKDLPVTQKRKKMNNPKSK
ncbi:hypothetical protein DAPPUDRAFT_249438 [Daphnia pulex]|uniref:Uncharacterized protein n=1 Tax=Daphnia pulex TaxID=6669 RepID=E9GWN5_DAPPU|nr:hypothetical protein DAPPUDRAFT_249438 [Daphnia pulex]|eukprot:EFX76147.1 hypothetical protein DAPPUDRAFT_249438 [Daphnia pulex]